MKTFFKVGQIEAKVNATSFKNFKETNVACGMSENRQVLTMKTFNFIIATTIFLLTLVSTTYATNYDIVIVRDDSTFDLAVAQVYAQSSGLPLLTVTKDGIGKELITEFRSYSQQGYNTALIIGGEDVVSAKVEENLKSMNYTAARLWDWNRYGTAARVAVSLWEESSVVVVAQGDEEGNLLSAMRTAINYKSPLLFTETDKIPDETSQAIKELKAGRIIIVGNIDENVRKELSVLGSVEVKQAGGAGKTEPGSIGYLFAGIAIGVVAILLVSGFLGVKWLRKKGQIPYSILQEDEQKLIGIIQENKGIIKQQDLPNLSGFSRPKVSRLVFELERRGILKREKTGKTRIVRLVKNVVKG